MVLSRRSHDVDCEVYGGILDHYMTRWEKFLPDYDYEKLVSTLVIKIDDNHVLPIARFQNQIYLREDSSSDIVILCREINIFISENVLSGLNLEMRRKIITRFING